MKLFFKILVFYFIQVIQKLLITTLIRIYDLVKARSVVHSLAQKIMFMIERWAYYWVFYWCF